VKKSLSMLSYNGKLEWIVCVGLLLLTGEAVAAQSLGDMASSIYGTFTNVTQLITAGSYLAGLAFSIGAIMKFKQHKDNPTQIPIGTPIALVFIAAALLFLPTILDITGVTMFGKKGTVAGPTGTVYGT
jgi:intracellular multiplication protein IcmD